MKEITYITKKVKAESGSRLTLSYSVLISDETPACYGVKVIEKSSGDCMEAPALTTNVKQIYELVDKLARNTVTPTGLMDVLADLL